MQLCGWRFADESGTGKQLSYFDVLGALELPGHHCLHLVQDAQREQLECKTRINADVGVLAAQYPGEQAIKEVHEVR